MNLIIKQKNIQIVELPSLGLKFHVWVNPPSDFIQRVNEFHEAANVILTEILRLNRVSLGRIYGAVGLRERNLFIRWVSLLLSQGPKNTRWNEKKFQRLADELDIYGMAIVIDAIWDRVILEKSKLN